MHYHGIPCNTPTPRNTMQYLAIPCITKQYNAIQCNTIQHHAVPCIINNCWRSVPLPCGQYKAIFDFLASTFVQLITIPSLYSHWNQKSPQILKEKMKQILFSRWPSDQNLCNPSNKLHFNLEYQSTNCVVNCLPNIARRGISVGKPAEQGNSCVFLTPIKFHRWM